MSDTRARSQLIPLLQKAQQKWGYLASEALREIARELRIPESKVYGVATFYAQFKLTRQGKRSVKICRGTACHVRGGARILAETKKRLGLQEGETSPDYQHTLETVACIGACALAPCLTINEEVHGRLNTIKVAALFGGEEDA
ncbi:NAD(P)H-dependent oxidoreductase subunit E [Candidatus Acetothermia bacterium]|jgi:NADH-quinone oxidoreductase subunit E|nr:NAD(P)H-dependent oxidoreductase subunit E [Candidatus Acetothermia bacterium]MCI2432716.1 NAD(P)H-dependent oxidoreductase subunit E [Candidatus Acetothermia bacterium]MCI2436863.1 NAD(P)H-dependent oxidoreductase subunit E [Candidatus Acetothermia bacterium]